MAHKINTIEDLYQHLQWAIEVEHFTIPPYLCALYSIPDGKNVASAQVIRSVVMEEMLHMILVANIMNAVGTHPILDTPGFIPDYPKALPHSADTFQVDLRKFSPEAIDTFMKIENPTPKDTPVNPDHYKTIGELYDAVEEGLKNLVDKYGHQKIFKGKKKYQITSDYYYGGGGIIMEVHNLETAVKAIAEVKEQGEGFVGNGDIFDGDEKYGQEPEVAHFYRFKEIKLKQYYNKDDKHHDHPSGPPLEVNYNDVYPMRLNPKVSDYPKDSEIREIMNDFNKHYTLLLRTLHHAFRGKREKLLDAVKMMYNLKYKAKALMKIPSGDGKTTVGPSFEYYSG